MCIQLCAHNWDTLVYNTALIEGGIPLYVPKFLRETKTMYNIFN